MSYSVHMEFIVTRMHINAHIFTFLFIISAFVAVRTRDIHIADDIGNNESNVNLSEIHWSKVRRDLTYYKVYIAPFLKICHRNDPNLNECVKQSINSLRPYLKTGIPVLQIPPCEPLHVPQIEISESVGPVSVRSTYTDIEVHGGTSFILKSVKVDIDNNCIKLKLYLPCLEMNARYNMEGKILMMPINGNGLVHGNFTDIDVIVTIQGERYQSRRTDETHYRVTDFYVDLDVGQANIHLDNLFNGDDTLSNAMNLFLNDNWKIVAAEIKPALENTVSEIFKTFSNKFYSKFPLDTLLPS